MSEHAILTEPGNYRAYPIDWALEAANPTEKNGNSHAQPVKIRWRIYQKWHPDQSEAGGAWSQAWPDYRIDSWTYIIGRDGQPSEKPARQLIDAGLWNGDLDAFAGEPPKAYALISVESDNYQGQAKVKVRWISPNADKPPAGGGAFTPTEKSVLDSVRSRFGSSFRAMAGQGAATAAGAAPQPAGPAAPSPAPANAQPPAQPAQQHAAPMQPGQVPPANTAPAPPGPANAAGGAALAPPNPAAGGAPAAPPGAPTQSRPVDPTTGEPLGDDQVPF